MINSIYTIITNLNFNSVCDFKGPDSTLTNFKEYGFRRDANNNIEFYTNFISCPCIYWIRSDKGWAFSFDYRLVEEYCKNIGIELSENYENLSSISDNIKFHIKQSIKQTYKCNFQYIEGWKKVILFEDGSFDVTNYDLPLFSLDIKYNYDAFKQFLLKYKKAIKKLIDSQLFIPTLTAGIDSRGLSGLWKEYVDLLPGYFLMDIKNDGKNHVQQGAKEIELASYVANALNLKNVRYKELPEPVVTMTGILNENAIAYDNPNDPEYIYKIIQHSWGPNNYHRKLTPFIDDDYLVFKQDGELFRLLLIFLLNKELAHIPFLSGTSMFSVFPNGHVIWPAKIDYIEKIYDIFNYWGEEKVKNILSE